MRITYPSIPPLSLSLLYGSLASASLQEIRFPRAPIDENTPTAQATTSCKCNLPRRDVQRPAMTTAFRGGRRAAETLGRTPLTRAHCRQIANLLRQEYHLHICAVCCIWYGESVWEKVDWEGPARGLGRSGLYAQI